MLSSVDVEKHAPTRNIKTTNYRMVSISAIFNMTTPGDGDGVESWEDVLDRKAEEGGFDNLIESVRNIGFLWPIFNQDGVIKNGHHRLAAAVELGYTHVPLTDNRDECGWYWKTTPKQCSSSNGPDYWDNEVGEKLDGIWPTS